MTIGQLAKAARVHIETVRYYQRRGLMKQPGKPSSGYRRYAPAALQQLNFIRRAQQLGFTLEEIRQLFRLSRPKDQPQAVVIVRGRRTVLKKRYEQLARIVRALDRLLAKARRRRASTIVDLINETAA